MKWWATYIQTSYMMVLTSAKLIQYVAANQELELQGILSDIPRQRHHHKIQIWIVWICHRLRHTLSHPKKTKPVYRKTPVPCRRMTRISTDSDLTLLPYFERDQAGRDNKLKISGKSSLQLIVWIMRKRQKYLVHAMSHWFSGEMTQQQMMIH